MSEAKKRLLLPSEEKGGMRERRRRPSIGRRRRMLDAETHVGAYARAIRGGAWDNNPFGLRCCERIFARAASHNKGLVSGFRVAADLDSPALS